MKTFKFALLALTLALSLAACKKAPVESHTTTGKIKAIQENGRILVIEHQAFPNWMEGMTMPFELQDQKMGAGLSAGDKVEFTVSLAENGYPITAIKKLQP